MHDWDSLWTMAALVPLAIAAAAWALQMACGFCSVDPPEFWHAVTTIVIVAFANVVLRFFLQMTDTAESMTAEYFAPGLATATVIAVALPTGPFSAVTITMVEVVLCGLLYYFVGWCAALFTASIYA